MTQDRYVSVREAALRMKISEKTVSRALEERLIHGKKDGAWRVSEESVQAFEENPGKLLELPLTADDFHCADCGEPMIRCNCG